MQVYRQYSRKKNRTDEPYSTGTREIVLTRFTVYIRVCGQKKNDETCRTHAKKYLNSICLQIQADYVTFLFVKRFL